MFSDRVWLTSNKLIWPLVTRVLGLPLVEMNRIGVNLNQIARALHRGRDTPDHLEFLLHEFYTVLQKVGRSLS